MALACRPKGPFMIAGWEAFFEAEAGASASLAGLIFVGVSINISRIVSIPKLPGRAIQALAVLLAVLVSSLVLLVPGQDALEVGLEVVAVGLVVWASNLTIDIKNYGLTDAEHKRSHVMVVLLDMVATSLYVVSGVSIVVWGPVGVYVLVPATVASFVKAIVDAWVLLVEINR